MKIILELGGGIQTMSHTLKKTIGWKRKLGHIQQNITLESKINKREKYLKSKMSKRNLRKKKSKRISRLRKRLKR